MLKTEEEIERAAAIVQGMLDATTSGEIPITPGSIVDIAIYTAYANLFCWILHGNCVNGTRTEEWLKRGEVELRDLGYQIGKADH